MCYQLTLCFCPRTILLFYLLICRIKNSFDVSADKTGLGTESVHLECKSVVVHEFGCFCVGAF